MSAGHSLNRAGLGALAVLVALGGVAFAADTKEKQKDKPYPLTLCLVSDEKLGNMGEPHVIVYNGREIKFCCDHCEKDFRKEPQKYLAKLEKAARAAATQPSTKPAGRTKGGQQDGHVANTESRSPHREMTTPAVLRGRRALAGQVLP